MVGQPAEPLDAQKSVKVKLGESAINPDNPWSDDLLARHDIAQWTTNLVATQELPLTIGLHGQWGTGKTFLLKRWQKELERQGFEAIYFNAWEDDFCDDPLLAIVGQLSSHFTGGRFEEVVGRVTTSALPLFRRNVSSVLTRFTGLTTDYEHDSPIKDDLIKQYLGQRRSKDILREELKKLSATVYTESNHPLIFIVDELDRCRPTFAIELLERVKHIFDVPNMVFVFGLNRDELSKSLVSVYGDINADVYLRRFFDFEFNLQEIDSQGFAGRLMDRFQLDQVFQSLSGIANDRVHWDDYDNFRTVVPRLWSALGLSLRDIDYGVRLLALLSRNIRPGDFTHPYVLVILIAMRFKDQEIYRSLVTGNFRTSEVMDYIDGELRQNLVDENVNSYLDRGEGFLYCTDLTNTIDRVAGKAAMDALSQETIRMPGAANGVLSRRALGADQEQRERILQGIRDGRRVAINRRVLGHVASFIDTYRTQLRR